MDLETRTTLPHTHITLTLLEIHRPATILTWPYIYDILVLHWTASRGFCILLTTEFVPKIFPNLNVPHLVIPVGSGSCQLSLAVLTHVFKLIALLLRIIKDYHMHDLLMYHQNI